MTKKGKEYKVIASSLLDCTLSSYYNWDKQQRPIISLLEKYFSKEDIEEFLKDGKIQKLEQQLVFQDFLQNLKKQYFAFLSQKFSQFYFVHEVQAEYYFKYLYYLKSRFDQFEIHRRPFSAAATSFALKFEVKDQKLINEFSSLLDLIEFMDDTPGMAFYFKYLLENDLAPLLENIDIDEYSINKKISLESKKSPFDIEEVSHYYMYHCYNNIDPYKKEDIQNN